MPEITTVAKSKALEKNARQVIIAQNVNELDITSDILNDKQFERPDRSRKMHQPIGISINGVVIGEGIDPSAEERGWLAYMNIGAPLINERSNISQPSPETVAYNEYINLDTQPKEFQALSNFNVDNSTTWSITGEGRLTFQTRQMEFAEKSYEQMKSSETNVRGSYQSFNVDEKFTSQNTVTDTVHLEDEFLAQIQLAITGSVGGQLTVSALRSTTASGQIPANSRIKVLTTQRRLVRNFDYSLPITFAGAIALAYPEEVWTNTNAPSPNPVLPETYAKVIAYDLSRFRWNGKDFTQTGFAETVSSLEAKSIIYKSEPLSYENTPFTA